MSSSRSVSRGIRSTRTRTVQHGNDLGKGWPVARSLGLVFMVAALGGAGCASKLERNKALVRRSHEELWSQGKLSLVGEIYSPTFVCHLLTGPEWEGRECLTKEVSSHRTSFPD